MHLPAFQVNGVDVSLYWAVGIGKHHCCLCLLVEAQEALYHEVAFGHLSHCLLLQVVEVEMVVAILLTLHKELRCVPWKEGQRVERLHVFLVCLAVELFFFLASCSVVAHEAAVVLVAVELKHVDGRCVGAPRDVGEIAVGRVASVKVDGLLCVEVIHSNGHLVARHSRHRIFVGFEGRLALEGVHLRIVGHHRLVHAVEGEPLSVGTPEETFLNAELVAVYGLSIHYLSAAVGGQLCVHVIGVGHVELVVFYVGMCLRLIAKLCCRTVVLVDFPHHFLHAEVVDQYRLFRHQQHLRLVGVGAVGVEQRIDLVVLEQCVHVLYIK